MARLSDPLRKARTAVGAGDFRVAWDDLQRAGEGVTTTAEWQLLAAMTIWRLGDFGKSRSTALQARVNYRTVGDVDGEMKAENVAAAGAFALGDLDEAEQGFLRAREMADAIGNGLLAARCANNLGNVHYYRGHYVPALNSYSLAVAGFEKERFDYGLVEAWHNMGIVLRNLDQLESSRNAADRAVDLAKKIGASRLYAQAMSSRAETLTLQGDIALARAMVDRVITQSIDLEDRLTQIDALRVLSIVDAASGDHISALKWGNESLELATELDHGWMIAAAERQLGNVYRDTGDTERALDAYRTAASNYERIGSFGHAEDMRKKVNSMQDRLGLST